MLKAVSSAFAAFLSGISFGGNTTDFDFDSTSLPTLDVVSRQSKNQLKINDFIDRDKLQEFQRNSIFYQTVSNANTSDWTKIGKILVDNFGLNRAELCIHDFSDSSTNFSATRALIRGMSSHKSFKEMPKWATDFISSGVTGRFDFDYGIQSPKVAISLSEQDATVAGIDKYFIKFRIDIFNPNLALADRPLKSVSAKAELSPSKGEMNLFLEDLLPVKDGTYRVRYELVVTPISSKEFGKFKPSTRSRDALIEVVNGEVKVKIPLKNSNKDGESIALAVKDHEELMTSPLAKFLNKPLPPLKLSRFVANDTISSETILNFNNKVVLLDLWAVWCSHCKAAMPSLSDLHTTLKSRDFRVVSLCLDDQRDHDSFNTITRPYSQIFALAPKSIFDLLGVTSFPSQFLIDRNGKVRWVSVGRTLPPKFIIENLLKESK